MSSKVHLDLIKKALVLKVTKSVPYTTKYTSLKVRRVKANEFKFKGRHETAGESCTLFTQFVNGYKNRPDRWKKKGRTPFKVSFVNENSQDCGGPMRDAISNLCEEVTSPELLPLLRPTANNLSRVEPSMDCLTLNSSATEIHVL